MSKLLLTCPRCSTEAENRAGEWVGAICSLCFLTEALTVYRAELVRLLLKRARYAERMIAVDNLDSQLIALLRRMVKKGENVLPENRKLVQKVVNEIYREGIQQATGFVRILPAQVLPA